MLKNLSPHLLTIIVSSVSTGFCAVILLVDAFIHNEDPNYLYLLIGLIILFIALYSIVRYLIERYINKRITPIYKIVRTREFTKKDKIDGEDFKKDIIGELNEQVHSWVNAQSEELATLKKLAEYRKNYVGNISHELKTPLFSIQGYIHTLLEDVEDPIMRRKFLKRAASNAERLNQIVNDLDTITKIESGTIVFQEGEFNLMSLVEEVIEDLQFQAEIDNIYLNFKESPLSSHAVKGDKEAIRQVLNNLLVNSIKYGNKEGTSSVEFSAMDNHILVDVSDNGPGIDKIHLPHLFDRFYRVDKSRNRGVGGSGLGLSIVKHIVEAHGQTINVRSSIGKGTSFTFTLENA